MTGRDAATAGAPRTGRLSIGARRVDDRPREWGPDDLPLLADPPAG